MNVNIAIHSYRLPLICPLQLAGEEMVDRTGWLIELTGDNGAKGWGEIAPLPGLSSEAELATMADWDGEHVDSEVVTPSVRCGMDMAFANLDDPEYLPGPLRSLQAPTRNVPVNALLIGEIDDMLRQAKAAIREGYQTMKIKLGRQTPADEVRLLQTINNNVSDETRFRLDVNRAWDPHDADRYLAVLSEMNVEYVEEPFASPQASLAWSEGTGVPVALDESLRLIEPEDLHAFTGLRALVLKPMLLGGLARCVAYAEAAREMGAYPVISSMLESGVGILNLARFASALCDPDTAAGLDTYRWLATDVLQPRIPFESGVITATHLSWDAYTVSLD